MRPSRHQSYSKSQALKRGRDGRLWPVGLVTAIRRRCSRRSLISACGRRFFPIGQHATYYPEVLKQVVAAGHTIGSHTWSHADLLAVTKKSGPDAAKEEIEKGASAVHLMAGVPIAPFFRFPDLRHPPEMVTYLGARNVATFSTDVDSWDFKIKKPEELIKSLIAKLQKAGKAIILSVEELPFRRYGNAAY
jgi:hypothetical protein